jgi:aspartyl-tRNA(Asn)/glutamyl-tRNA(Gln) amidotransferase subunit C
MIDEKTMANLQELSRIRLSPEEAASLASQLEDIIGYFALLSGFDTEGIDADLGTQVAPEDLRTDSAFEGVDRESIDSFAVRFENGFFVVPKILGDEPDA